MWLLKKGEKPKPICRVCRKFHLTEKCWVLRKWTRVAERLRERERTQGTGTA